MSQQIESAVDKIVRKSLDAYSTEKEGTQVAATTSVPKSTYGRKTATKATASRSVTSYEDYAKQVPAIRTPSVFSKAKVDEVLLQCRELPTPDKPQKNYAGYSRKEWDTLVEVVTRYTADVCEGAGLHYKGMFSPDAFKRAMSVALQENFFHHDPYDKRNRYISVDGRIDSDERKP